MGFDGLIEIFNYQTPQKVYNAYMADAPSIAWWTKSHLREQSPYLGSFPKGGVACGKYKRSFLVGSGTKHGALLQQRMHGVTCPLVLVLAVNTSK